MPNKKIIVRAEDVPLFVEQLRSKGNKCIGVTGEDLFYEYKLKNSLSNIIKITKVPSYFSRLPSGRSVSFLKPTLCLLGPQGKTLNLLEKELVVAIDQKYTAIAEKFLKEQQQKGFKFKKIFLRGATEELAKTGIADLVIDVVFSGAAARDANLKVYERIFEGDVILVGDSNE